MCVCVGEERLGLYVCVCKRRVGRERELVVCVCIGVRREEGREEGEERMGERRGWE